VFKITRYSTRPRERLRTVPNDKIDGMAPSVRYSDAILRIVVEPGLCIARWADAPLAHHFPRVTEAMHQAAQGSGGAALFNVVDARGKLPRFDEEVRKAATRMARDITPYARATAHVLLLDGFTGAAVRMFLSTLALLTRSSAPDGGTLDGGGGRCLARPARA